MIAKAHGFTQLRSSALALSLVPRTENSCRVSPGAPASEGPDRTLEGFIPCSALPLDWEKPGADVRFLLLGASRAQVSGFTLIELMVVVVIMGVLAALATFGVRRYVLEAKKAEAASMITQIRAAEEAYRDETFAYVGMSNFALWHPEDEPEARVYSWSKSTAVFDTVFGPLGVQPTGGVQYSYCVVAGGVDDSIPPIPTTKVFDFPEPTGPFYIAMAKADLNGDGTFTYALSHSDSSEIHIDNTF